MSRGIFLAGLAAAILSLPAAVSAQWGGWTSRPSGGAAGDDGCGTGDNCNLTSVDAGTGTFTNTGGPALTVNGPTDGGVAVSVAQGGHLSLAGNNANVGIGDDGTDVYVRGGSYGKSIRLAKSTGNVTFPYGIIVNTGPNIGHMAGNNFNIDFAGVTSGCEDSPNLTLTGAAVSGAGGDSCIVTPSTDGLPSTSSWVTCRVTAANTVVVRHCAFGATGDPGAADYTVRLIGR